MMGHKEAWGRVPESREVYISKTVSNIPGFFSGRVLVWHFEPHIIKEMHNKEFMRDYARKLGFILVDKGEKS